MYVTSQKQLATWLPAEKKIEAEQWRTSAVSAQNGVPQQLSETT